MIELGIGIVRTFQPHMFRIHMIYIVCQKLYGLMDRAGKTDGYYHIYKKTDYQGKGKKL